MPAGGDRNFRKGLLAHLILVPAWTAAPVLLLSGLVTAGFPYGWIGILIAVAIGAGLVASDTMAIRGPLCLILIAGAALAPSGRVVATGAAVWCSFLAWLCKGGKGDYSRRPALWDFLSTWRGHYYKQAELRGHFTDIKKGKSCFAFHPHGCLSAGFTINGCFNPEFIKHAGKVNWLCDYNLRFKNPFFRMMCDGVRRDDHAILGADKKTFLSLMAGEESISFIPGGFQDAVAFANDKDITVLKRRKGFIKYCLQHGYRLHPVYTFGESQTFNSFTGLRKLRMRVAEYNIPMAMFFGWWACPILPKPETKLVSYVGKALDCPHIPDPSSADVDKWHGEYMKALTALFNEKRAEAGWPNAQLEIL